MGDVIEMKQSRQQRLPKDQRVKVQLDVEQVAFVEEIALRDRCSRSAAISKLLTERMIQEEKSIGASA